VAKIDDGGGCSQGLPGACYKGSCCSGCINAKGICQAGNQADSCGLTTPNNLVQCKTCVDGDPCTSDVCDQTGACSNPVGNENGSCSDGDACNGAETCQGGSCTKQANFSCPTDNNVCHAPSCDAVKGCGQQNLSGNACNDGNVCNGADTCSNGVCQPGATIKTCDDGNPCTVDSCDPKLDCQHVALEAGSSCDNDKDVCNGSGICDANKQCVPVAAPKCDDGNVCTDDKCDPVKGCFKVNNAASCSDNNLCTTNDKCSGGTCVGGAAPTCNDGEECTTDTCDPAVGCVNAAVKPGTLCSDSNACTTTDVCDQKGKCVGSGGPSCEDNNPCTQNFCDVLNGQACSNPAEKDGITCALDKCHQNTTCTAGKCGGGIAISCDDDNPCTTDTCDAETGCKHTADPKGVCSDGDVCTTGDACVSGVCTGKAMTCSPIDDCHVAGTCNTKTGQCDDPRADDDTACDGGDGTCKTGKCVANPGAGGAGGETGVGGEGTSGSGVTQGGKPPVVGAGGEGNEPTTGGTSETGGKNAGGKGGRSSQAGTTSQDGGAADIPEHVFVREPGGCSCRVPGHENSQNSTDFAWLGAAGLAALVAARRRRPSASKPRIVS
jgi:MYXO-CTERM domain-containing protein